MEDLVMLDAVERYLNGQMNEAEQLHFEQLRTTHPEIDQMVVEQHAFLKQLDTYGRHKAFKHQLHNVHNQLVEAGSIVEKNEVDSKVRILHFWKKYRTNIGVAASIAGVTTLTVFAALQLLTPKASPVYLQNLGRKITALEKSQNAQNKAINDLITAPNSKVPESEQISGGTSFLIDGDGYLVTNYHVVNGASTLIVVNNNHDYIAKSVYTDPQNDIAILKIEDEDWKEMGQVPYGIRKNAAELGEELFTLGFPRNSVVYNKGYLSASTGYDDDSLSIQLSISANPGNSGGPVLDKNGNIIGILSTRDRQANDVVFATKAINISKAIEELKKDTAHRKLQLPSRSAIKNLDRVAQIKKLQDCVFMVKGY